MEVRSLEQRLRIIANWRDQFPEFHLLIVVKNKGWARTIAAELSGMIGSPVSWGSGDRNGYPWTHVDGVFTFSGRSIRDWSLVAFLDAELALSETALRQLSLMVGAVRLGFLTRDERDLPEMDRAILECGFGPVVYRSGDAENATTVAVAWLDPPSYTPAAARNRLQAKCQYIWRNDARKRLIAQVARAFECGNREAIQRHGLGEAADWISEAHAFGELSVAIVVETVEHGHEIVGQLPGWTLYTASLGADDELEPVVAPRSIVTLRRASNSFVAANVVVYAVGSGVCWLDNLGPQCELLSGSRMLVVDVADDCDPETVRQLQCRAGDYRHRKWEFICRGTPKLGRKEVHGGITGGESGPAGHCT